MCNQYHYDRRNDPNDGIVSAYLTLPQFLVGLLLGVVFILTMLGYAMTN